MESKEFRSNTIFFAPLWTDNFDNFVSEIKNDKRYEMLDKNKSPQYLLPYITRIFCDENLFVEFELKKEYFPDIYMFDSIIPEGGKAELCKIRLCCFSTGCIFMEFHICYKNLSLDDIADFSFRFKNIKIRKEIPSAKISMEKAISVLVPKETGAFLFNASSTIKNECRMFHQILAEGADIEEIKRHLIHLRRGYHRAFPIPNTGEEYDMLFEPYEYDHWAGSQEGIVNIFYYSENDSANKFIRDYKPTHLAVDYRFMYLVLLNQRFSAISYLEKIPLLRSYTKKQREKMNLMTSSLKTIFSFSIVSDDQLYQTVYSKMYEIMGIDRLLSDIKDNEEQIEILQRHEMLKTEKITSAFLFGLSILSLFSVLVDAAGYFDRIPILQPISTVLSALCLVLIIALYIVWWIDNRNK